MIGQILTFAALSFLVGLIFVGGFALYVAAAGIGILYLIILLLFNQSYLTVPNRDICNLVPSSPLASANLFVSPSFWTAQVFFFASYLIQNALSLYRQEPVLKADKRKVQNRKDQAMTAVIVTSILVSVIVLVRYNITGCETGFGIAIAALTMVPLGIGWYKFAEICGVRHADVFGLAGKMISTRATEPPPMMCVNKA